MVLALLIVVIVLGLIFTFTNGFQDGSSVTATAIGCRAMTPVQAVCLVATFEFLGALLGGSAVANTIGSVTSWPDNANLLPVLIAGLSAAITWNFVTKRLGLPSSSTHALIGGILGSVIAGGGGSFKYIVWGDFGAVMHATGVIKVVLSLFVSPVVGFVVGALLLKLIYLVLIRATNKVNGPLKRLQWFTIPVLAFAHGANDTQKSMGVIALALSASGLFHENGIPLWVRLLTGSAMALGIICLAPSIVKRVGSGIYHLRVVHGFTAQLGSAAIVLYGSLTGGPVSASQVISSCVMGIGYAERRKGVHWLVARDMLTAWFLTIPCAGLLAGILYFGIFQWLDKLL